MRHNINQTGRRSGRTKPENCPICVSSRVLVNYEGRYICEECREISKENDGWIPVSTLPDRLNNHPHTAYFELKESDGSIHKSAAYSFHSEVWSDGNTHKVIENPTHYRPRRAVEEVNPFDGLSEVKDIVGKHFELLDGGMDRDKALNYFSENENKIFKEAPTEPPKQPLQWEKYEGQKFPEDTYYYMTDDIEDKTKSFIWNADCLDSGDHGRYICPIPIEIPEIQMPPKEIVNCKLCEDRPTINFRDHMAICRNGHAVIELPFEEWSRLMGDSNE